MFNKLNDKKMKKIYLLLFCITTSFMVTAQNSSTVFMQKHEFMPEKIKSNLSAQPKGVVLWENQFDNASDWILDNSCAYSAYTIVGGYDYANQTVINAPSACTSPGTVATDPGTGNTAQWRFETDVEYY